MTIQEQIILVGPGALLSQATQTFNNDLAILARRGYQPPQALLQLLLWNVPSGQLLDSFSRLPLVGHKTIGDATYFAFDSKLLVRASDELRFVPGRYGVASAIKLESAPTAVLAHWEFGASVAGLDPAWAAVTPSRVSGDVNHHTQRLAVVAGPDAAGVTCRLAAVSGHVGKFVSISAGAYVYTGDLQAVATVHGYDDAGNHVYAHEVPLVWLNNRFVGQAQTPGFSDFGNLPGFGSQTVARVGFELTYFSVTGAVADLYGGQVEQGCATSLRFGAPRGVDRLSYKLPEIAPSTVTLAFWARFPLQSTGLEIPLFGSADATIRLVRRADTPANDPRVSLVMKTVNGTTSATLVPLTSFLDERPHLVAIGLGYDGDKPAAYLSVDGVELGLTVDAGGRPCTFGLEGSTWALDNLLKFSDGTVELELENPVLFAGVLGLDEIAILANLSVPIQSMTAPPSLSTSGLSPWQVFNVQSGVTTQIQLNATGLTLADVNVDEVPQYEGIHYHYDPETGLLDFAHPHLPEPGPIDGDVLRVRHVAQAFAGDDAYTLNGRQGISADDPRVGTVEAANMYLALDRLGRLPVLIGQNAADFVKKAQLGYDVAELERDRETSQRWLKLSQRPIASEETLGCVKIGPMLKLMTNQQLTLIATPLWDYQLGTPTHREPDGTLITGIAKLDEEGMLHRDHRPKATTTELGMVKIKALQFNDSAESEPGNGLIVDSEGYLDLSVDDAVSKSSLGPLGGFKNENDELFRRSRVPTLISLTRTNPLTGVADTQPTWWLDRLQRPIAGPGPKDLGCIILGDSLKGDFDTGVAEIARLGEAALPATEFKPELPGVATTDVNNLLAQKHRPKMSKAVRGMAKIGPGFQMGVVTDTQDDVLNYNLGNGLWVDGEDRLGIHLVSDIAGLEFVDGQLKVKGHGYVPVETIPDFNPAEPYALDWDSIKLALLVDGVLREDQRPVAQVGDANLPTPATLGMVQLAADSVLSVDEHGFLRADIAGPVTQTEGMVGSYGVVKLGFANDTGLFIDVDDKAPNGVDPNPYKGCLRVKPITPDFTDYNQRQERNLAADLIGRWVTYSLVEDGADTGADRGAYVESIRKITTLNPKRTYWELALSTGQAIEYTSLTAVPPTNLRGYLAGGSTSGGDALSYLERITGMGVRVPVKATLETQADGLFKGVHGQSCGAGFADAAWFFGGFKAGAAPTDPSPTVDTITKLDANETWSRTVTLSGGARARAAAAAVTDRVFITGGVTDLSRYDATLTNVIDELKLEAGAPKVTKLQITLSAATANDEGRRAEHAGFGCAYGGFFFTGQARGAMANATVMQWVRPDGRSCTTETYALSPRVGAACAPLNGFGYIAGGRCNTTDPTYATFQVLQRFDPANKLNVITGARLVGVSPDTGLTGDDGAERYTTAGVGTGNAAFFAYDESALTDVVATHVLDRLDGREHIERVATRLGAKRPYVAGASVGA